MSGQDGCAYTGFNRFDRKIPDAVRNDRRTEEERRLREARKAVERLEEERRERQEADLW